jgi:hypothetical protein
MDESLSWIRGGLKKWRTIWISRTLKRSAASARIHLHGRRSTSNRLQADVMDYASGPRLNASKPSNLVMFEENTSASSA